MDGTSVLVVATAISAFIWKLIDTVKAGVGPNRLPSVVWLLLAFVVGVFIAVVSSVNLFDTFGQTTNLTTGTGEVMSGLAMGAGAGFLYDVVEGRRR